MVHEVFFREPYSLICQLQTENHYHLLETYSICFVILIIII